ncbi:MAG: ACP S-malonyltransferase [Roseiarcus sp.]
MKTALVFPGQGSQAVGMGKALAEAFAESREVFERVDAALGEKLSRLVFEGPEAELTLTANAQPALMATSLAALRALETEAGLDVAGAAFVAGHSLGEYSALCAAGALALEDTARLLRIRGRAMQAAVPVGAGAMAAILGLEFAAVVEIAAEAARACDAVCEAANDNGGGQVVVSGAKSAVEHAMALAKQRGAKRALPLPVSAPFHCALMRPAAEAMREALAGTRVAAPKVPLVANYSARALRDPDAIRQSLVDQVTGTVRWRESVELIAAEGVTQFVEIGAGKVLAGLVKRIAPGVNAISVGTPGDVEGFRQSALGAGQS